MCIIASHVHVFISCMHNVGSVSSGEFNSLRAKGYTRPISMFVVRSQVQNKYAKMSHKAMASMLTLGKYIIYYLHTGAHVHYHVCHYMFVL